MLLLLRSKIRVPQLLGGNLGDGAGEQVHHYCQDPDRKSKSKSTWSFSVVHFRSSVCCYAEHLTLRSPAESFSSMEGTYVVLRTYLVGP